MPLINKPIPHSIATAQKEISGIPKIMINPTRNNMMLPKMFEPHKLKTLRICDMNDTEQILSNRKYTPINAINHNKLILGTNNNKIPNVNAKTPIAILAMMFVM